MRYLKLNLDFNKSEKKDISEIEKEIIEKYINQYKEENYEEIFKQDNRLEVVLALSEIRKNIVNWYPFKADSNILELRGNLGEITGQLCEKANRVVTIEESTEKAIAIAKRHEEKENLEIIVGNIQDIILEEKFDYIIINGMLEQAPFSIKSETPFITFLEIATSYLKEDGKLLMATDNKFGIRYWNGKKDLDGTYEYRNLGTKRRKNQAQLFSEKNLDNMLKQAQINHNKFYYIFPDYKMPNLIYSKEYDISKEDISRNFTCYEEDELVSFVENDVLRELIKEDSKLMNFYANSFLIECSRNEIDTDIKYVSYTNYRKKEYRIMTIIKKDIVEKRAVSKESFNHIEQMKQNREILKQYNIKTLEQSKDDYLESEFVKDFKRYDLWIDECDDIEEAIEAIKPYIEKLYQNGIAYDKIKQEELCHSLQECDQNQLKQFKYLEYGFMDFIPKNIFYNNGELCAFDQEWMEKYIPVEHILYRAIINSNLYRKFSDDILKRLDLIKNREIFNKIEGEFGEKIIDTIMLNEIFNRKTRNRNDLLKEICDKNELLHKQEEDFHLELNKVVQENEANKQTLKEREQTIDRLNQSIHEMVNSKSWKITKPLREVTKYLSNGGNK